LTFFAPLGKLAGKAPTCRNKPRTPVGTASEAIFRNQDQRPVKASPTENRNPPADLAHPSAGVLVMGALADCAASDSAIFFRGLQAWQALEAEVIAPMVENKQSGEAVRAWVAGCADGQEAYALAMLLLEHVSRRGKRCPVRVFATDTAGEALQAARLGRYPEATEAQLPTGWLARFFLAQDGDGYYPINDELRGAVVFGRHVLCADPPPLRLDILVCRHRLQDLEPPARQKAVKVFAAALNLSGCLVVAGGAAALGQRGDAFEPLAGQPGVYRKIAASAAWDRPTPPGTVPPTPMAEAIRLAQQTIMQSFSPPAVLVNAHNEAVYFSGPTEKVLAPPAGKPTQDIFAWLREGLRSPLRRALEAAAIAGLTVVEDAWVKRDGVRHPLKLTVKPVARACCPEPLWLVVFEERPPPSPVRADVEDDALRRRLEEALAEAEADRRDALQRLEASEEALCQAVAERLAANEEWASAQAEWRWLKQDLECINRQAQSKRLLLEAANQDLQSLLASSEFACLCLDQALRIKSFTPALADIMGIIPADAGRPVSHLADSGVGQGLLDEAKAVLQSGQSSQREVQAENQRWYIRRLLPDRLADGPVNGVTMTFTDISESKRAAFLAIEAKNALAETLEQRVRERTQQLRMLTVELGLAEERERRRLAEELHDDLGQVLAIAKIKLASMNLNERRGSLKAALKEVYDLIGQANESVRSLAFQMSPLAVLDLGLMPTVEWLADEMRKKYGLSIAVDDDGKPKPLPEATKTIVFRALRELLINAAKHSGTLGAQVRLRRRDAVLVATVVDHGQGFDPAADNGQAGFGLASIRERMGYIGGSLHIESRPGDGVAVTLTVPLELDISNSIKGEQP